MGKKRTVGATADSKGYGARQPVSPEVVSAAGDEAVATARHDAPQEWALLDRVLDGSPVGIIVLDSDLRLLRVNTRAEEMFGITERDRAGETVESVLPTMYAEIRTILADIIAGGAPHVAIETTAPRVGPATPPRMYLAYYYPLAAEGAVIGVGCMFFDVTDQRIAEGALLDSEAERRAILGHMLRVEESERSRLALELHDDTIQVLCAVLLQFDGMIPLAERTGQRELATRLGASRQVLSTATERARKLMFELHPSVLPERGLHTAIRALAQEVGDEIHAEWTVDVPDRRFPWTVEELTYRVVREALTNIRKHSHARTFSVCVTDDGGHLSATVQDDGRGLTTSGEAAVASPNHLGVDGMRERARLAGGDVTITSTPGNGVRVHLTLPTVEHGEPGDSPK